MSFSRLSAGGPGDSYWQKHAAGWLLAIIALGIGARVVRWVLCFPLWSDEAFLSASFLQRGYADMFRPLEYHQVCPPGFLWAQLSAVRLLGFCEWTLRLVPLAAGLGALLLFARLARRLLSGTAVVLAVAVFACSYPGIRYASEAKPYATDVLISVGLLSLAVEWLRRPRRGRWLWALTGAAPLAILVSFPAVFVAAAISLAGLFVLLGGKGCRASLFSWLAFNLSVAAGLLVLYVFCVRVQSGAELSEVMQPYWHSAFPPLATPRRLAAWLCWTHTGEMLAHPVGGPGGGSVLTAVCCLLGAVGLWRRRRVALLALAIGPFAFNFVVAAAQRYPYGGHVRVALYLMPLVCLLAGFGAALVLARLASGCPRRAGWTQVLLLAMALVPVGSMVRDAFCPWKTPSDGRTRDFARWFWVEESRGAELVCLTTDWSENLAPDGADYFYSSLYVCNQRIYSPRHRRGAAPRLDRVSARHPLRCVQYHSHRNPLDEQAVAAWLTRMAERWRLVDRRQYRVTHTDKRDRLVDVSMIELWEFVPTLSAAQRPSIGLVKGLARLGPR